MAKVINGLILGTVGPLEYYVINGVQYVRLKATNVKLSDKTKQSARIFGSSSEIGRYIRDSLVEELPVKHDVRLMSSLTSRIFRSMTRQWNEVTQKFDLKEDGFGIWRGSSLTRGIQFSNF